VNAQRVGVDAGDAFAVSGHEIEILGQLDGADVSVIVAIEEVVEPKGPVVDVVRPRRR